MRGKALLVAVAGLGFVGGLATAQDHAGQYDQVDVEYGAQLYSGHCITCHGESGDLMPGANLRSGRFRHASSDRDLATLIREGIEGTPMIATSYSDSELSALVAYLRNMASFDTSSVAIGDTARGRALFEGKGECLGCHRVGDRGPRAAPDLTRVGSTRTAAILARVLVDPTGAMLPVNRPVRIVTSDGRVISGRRLNEDTFTIQVIDSQERLHTFDKATLRDFTVGTEATMPSYADALSAEERADIVAYLLSLKGSN
jgi:cytochrome c oxidase cbb3-type subunit III